LLLEKIRFLRSNFLKLRHLLVVNRHGETLKPELKMPVILWDWRLTIRAEYLIHYVSYESSLLITHACHLALQIHAHVYQYILQDRHELICFDPCEIQSLQSDPVDKLIVVL